jgi:hypothetical protein
MRLGASVTPSRSNRVSSSGVGALVADQEAGVDAVGDAFERQVHGVGVPTQARVGLEQGGLGTLAQRPGGTQAADAAAHHGDARTRAGRVGCGAARAQPAQQVLGVLALQVGPADEGRRQGGAGRGRRQFRRLGNPPQRVVGHRRQRVCCHVVLVKS